MKPYILPAVRSMKDLEKLTQTDYKECVLLDTHIGHVKSIMELLKKNHVETYMHIDLIKGMSHDEFACEYIIQNYHPKGIVSTKTKVINKAKALNTITVFRVFILDSHALNRSIELIKRVEPDFVEVLPGIATKAIQIINEETDTSVIAGGLINDIEEVDVAIENGAKYITTSDRKLW
ncbi:MULTISPECIES: glycerol-3-phosphate responsive antiterminator [Staphylococcus]|uniref:Glycerol uptake operon antiterminator regulatory protein n=1 Tax=Staphylococcus succinus TaxID=61015 RepID=A0ABX5IU56_9STAP|nr:MULTISPECIES: glycerol-3-phosphate responsive antiterminator [Staphylococcus]MDH9160470.1 glycerol-3-phosphate responsive antiterminator [Staphylococcus succinus]MEB8124400.1 glycerol-3-phosphate responsive antiterminator [Staphylococcus succinus]OIJ30582.1 glycerol-3-phosphate responsive antiterminator GlpP [Staphylococcus sp. LCT-H4]PNZ17772.1 glycerol-3-phosphate responsive antiterminator [Staphylococcus succinus subsp. succinus]PTI70504.1 glycerol-3-phosphate responsive antiterminator [